MLPQKIENLNLLDMAISKEKDRIVAHVPKELKEQLKKIAEAENRSLSGLIGFVLTKYVKDWKKANR